jgi:hypothetical protein
VPDEAPFAQPKSLISLGARFFLDEYRAVFAVNVTSPDQDPIQTFPVGTLIVAMDCAWSIDVLLDR